MSITDLDGQVLKTSLENSYQYNDLGVASEAEEDYATGSVIIYNEYGADQQLVATTRLLSQDGILFRTQENVVVPQNGSIEVAVKADEKGESGNIGPSTFEIVALNANKKEMIYGKSSQAMTGGLKVNIIVAEDDISKAKQAAEKDLMEKAYAEFQLKIADAEKNNISQNIIKNDADANLGEQASGINIDIAAEFTYSMFDKEKLIEACKNLLAKKNTENYEVIVSDKKKNLIFTSEYKYGKEIIVVNCKGELSLKNDSLLLDKSKLTNKTASQVKKYLEGFPEVEAAEIKLSPFWVKSTPFIKENIKIEIKEL